MYTGVQVTLWMLPRLIDNYDLENTSTNELCYKSCVIVDFSSADNMSFWIPGILPFLR